MLPRLFLLLALFASFSGPAGFSQVGAAPSTPPAVPVPPVPVVPSPAVPVPAPATVAAVPPNDPVEASVVKVFATARYPDFYRPWNKQAPTEATGSAVIIEGNRILTNAHVVQYASQIRVQANQSGDKISATIESIAPAIDLAVLKVEDESFFKDRPPLARASALPEVRDTVLVYGFPTGGSSLSITKGIVSRIEFTNYNLFSNGLTIQIDAAINPGNSGGPAVDGNKMIGLAFSRLGGADNIGYIIPMEEIEIFLKDVADGTYDGKPGAYDGLQTYENPALRPYLKAPKTAEGMIVTDVDDPSPTYPLKAWDLVTHIGKTPIDNEGKVRVGRNLRLGFNYLIQHEAKDGKLPLTIIRDGQTMNIELPVYSRRPTVIPQLQNAYPEYFICGPLVFSPATQQFVGGFNNVPAQMAFNAMGSPLVRRLFDRPAFPGEQVVVVSSPFFPHEIAKGYGNPIARVVKSINGVTIRNLTHLVEVLRDSRDEFLVFDFHGRATETLVFPREALLQATEEVLTDNGVRSQGTPDLMAVWGKK
jgi:S1-C subfamily serine protease